VSQSQQSLRELLETLAELEFVDGELSPPEARQLAASFRSCRLEYMRRARNPLSSGQSHRLQQLDYRLQLVADGEGSAESIRSEAIETLLAFGWSVPDLGF
jgi:uncharacterized Zn finger protein